MKFHYRKPLALLIVLFASACALPDGGPEAAPSAARSPAVQVRTDHPRLFLNASDWPSVRRRADSMQFGHLDNVRKRVATALAKHGRNGTPRAAADYGNMAMGAALLVRLGDNSVSVEQAITLIETSMDAYDDAFDAGKSVHWFAFSRLGWMAAVDWLWNDIPATRRDDLVRRMLIHADRAANDVFIRGKNRGGRDSGFYGTRVLPFYAGLLALDEGIDDVRARRLFEQGLQDHRELFRFRSELVAQNGSYNPTLAYAVGAYPLAEWNFLHTWRAATGEDLAPVWRYPTHLVNYLEWQVLPGGYEFGFGDASHVDNKFPGRWLHTHLAQIATLYANVDPVAANQAARLIHTIEVPKQFVSAELPILPFLVEPVRSAPPLTSESQARARDKTKANYFEGSGHMVIHNRAIAPDTFVLLATGGGPKNHRHYDAGHFTIFHDGHFAAVDAGSRLNNTDHLQNYFAQTVAHNTILIEHSGEPTARYWNGPVSVRGGGQLAATQALLTRLDETEDYVHVTLDLTPAYWRGKAERLSRDFVMFSDATIVVFDSIRATPGATSVASIVHWPDKPRTIDANSFRVRGDGVDVTVWTMSPTAATLDFSGGPGKEFEVGGRNFSLAKAGANRAAGEDLVTDTMGRWTSRMAAGPGSSDVALIHVIRLGGAGEVPTMSQSGSGDSAHRVLRLATDSGSYALTFANLDSATDTADGRCPDWSTGKHACLVSIAMQ